MGLVGKNIAINAIYYAVTAVALPAVVLMLDPWRRPTTPLRIAGAIAILAGAALQLWCITLFHRRGRGTPTPALPPVKLVTSGPYAKVRNPMNIGEVLVFAGMAGWFGSGLMAVYAVAAFVVFDVFVRRYEEPRLLRVFGGEYEEYWGRVGRWWVRG